MASSEEVKYSELGPLPPISSRNNALIHSFDYILDSHFDVEDEKSDNEFQFPRPLDINVEL